MQPLPALTQGLEILNPFLTKQGFKFDDYENGKGVGEQFTVGTYINGNKKFILSYHPSIGQVIYQFDKAKIYHDFYLDQLGLAYKKKFQDFLSADKLLAFTHILHDFEFLVDDFFQGQCIKLKEFSKQQDNILADYNKKSHEEFSIRFDKIRIETARDEFGRKDFKKTMGIYSKVENKNLLNDLDKNIIAYCKRHIL